MRPLLLPLRRCLAATTLLIITAGLVPDLRAEVKPPVYRDAEHVSRGCLISTLGYLARFAAEHPHEKSCEIDVLRRGTQGVSEPHTLALVTWSGQWWLRDEYLGVLPLGLPAGEAVTAERLRDRSEAALERGAKNYLRLGSGLPWPEAPIEWFVDERRRELARARRLLPLPGTIFSIRTGTEDVAMLFFRPHEGRVALYDPVHGTATAQTAAQDDAKLVAAMARLLGYRVDTVRAEP